MARWSILILKGGGCQLQRKIEEKGGATDGGDSDGGLDVDV